MSREEEQAAEERQKAGGEKAAAQRKVNSARRRKRPGGRHPSSSDVTPKTDHRGDLEDGAGSALDVPSDLSDLSSHPQSYDGNGFDEVTAERLDFDPDAELERLRGKFGEAA